MKTLEEVLKKPYPEKIVFESDRPGWYCYFEVEGEDAVWRSGPYKTRKAATKYLEKVPLNISQHEVHYHA